MFWFEFNGYNSQDYGIKIVETSPITITKLEINTIEVPGRTPLTSLGEYKGYTKEIICLVENNNLREFSWLKGIGILKLSWEPGVFFKAKLSEQLDFISLVKRKRTLSVVFEVEPFAYVDGITKITLTGTDNIVNNNYTVYSQPRIKVFGNGNVTLSINRKQFKINNLSEYAEVDSNLYTVSKGSTNLSNNFEGEFPLLNVGENRIIASSNITKIEIEPNWRWL